MSGSFLYNGWRVSRYWVKVPGGNGVCLHNVPGYIYGATWETCKAALDKAPRA